MARGRRSKGRALDAPEVTSVDEVSVSKLRRAVERRSVKLLLGGLGDLSLVLRTHYRGDTLMVLHLVIDRNQRVIKHYGILGFKGWSLDDPGLIEFKFRGRRYEFDVLKDLWRVKRFKRGRP